MQYCKYKYAISDKQAMDSELYTSNIKADLYSGQKAGLTPRQLEATSWAAEGKTDKEIGLLMGCTARTAKAHILNAMKQTDTHTRAQLVAQLFIRNVFTGITSLKSAAAFCLVLSITGGLTDGQADEMLRARTRTNASVRINSLGRGTEYVL